MHDLLYFRNWMASVTFLTPVHFTCLQLMPVLWRVHCALNSVRDNHICRSHVLCAGLTKASQQHVPLVRSWEQPSTPPPHHPCRARSCMLPCVPRSRRPLLFSLNRFHLITSPVSLSLSQHAKLYEPPSIFPLRITCCFFEVYNPFTCELELFANVKVSQRMRT